MMQNIPMPLQVFCLILIDSGKIAIPAEFKSLVKTLEQGSPTDKSYTGIIRELINNNIINVPNYTNLQIKYTYHNGSKIISNCGQMIPFQTMILAWQ